MRKYYEAVFQDVPCGHAHRTFEAAEQCGLSTIRAAKRGEQFGFPASSEWIARNYSEDEAMQTVHERTAA